jgi:hypothetical protein
LGHNKNPPVIHQFSKKNYPLMTVKMEVEELIMIAVLARVLPPARGASSLQITKYINFADVIKYINP